MDPFALVVTLIEKIVPVVPPSGPPVVVVPMKALVLVINSEACGPAPSVAGLKE